MWKMHFFGKTLYVQCSSYFDEKPKYKNNTMIEFQHIYYYYCSIILSYSLTSNWGVIIGCCNVFKQLNHEIKKIWGGNFSAMSHHLPAHQQKLLFRIIPICISWASLGVPSWKLHKIIENFLAVRRFVYCSVDSPIIFIRQ